MRFPPLTPLVRICLFLLTGCYIAQLILTVWMGATWPAQLVLFPVPGLHTLWQVATYPLLQGGAVFGFLLNLVFFWWIVAPFEQTFGRPHTLRLMGAATLGSAVPVLLLGLIFGDSSAPESLQIGPVLGGPLYGTNPHILAALTAFVWAIRFRGNVSFFGLFPLTTKQMLLLILGISALHFLASKDITALISDLGAMGTGLAYVEWMSRGPKEKPKKKRENKAGLRLVRDDDDPPKWLN